MGELATHLTNVFNWAVITLHHAIHHRAQLCLYLRLNDMPVPGMYGPTADEAGM